MTTRNLSTVEGVLTNTGYTYDNACAWNPQSQLCKTSKMCENVVNNFNTLLTTRDTETQDTLVKQMNACSDAFELAAKNKQEIADFLQSQNMTMDGHVMHNLKQQTCSTIKNLRASNQSQVTAAADRLNATSGKFINACASQCDSSCYMRASDGTKVSCEVKSESSTPQSSPFYIILLCVLVSVLILLILGIVAVKKLKH